MKKLVNGVEVEMSPEEVAAFIADQATGPTVEDYDRALTDHLDAVARERRWDNRITCALRAGFPGPWHNEGVAFAAWMDACNAQSYQLWQDVAAGQTQQPTIDAFIASLPTMQWPE